MASLSFAGPALASDTPIVEVPVVAEVPTPTIEVPEPVIPLPPAPPVPAIDEAAVVETTADGSNIDVSVRVLSPGEDAESTQKSEIAAISPESGGDITAADEPVPDAAPAGAVNTNVSVRVLSPGNNGSVTQASDGPEEPKDAATPQGGGGSSQAAPSSLAPGAPTDAVTDPKEPSQYQSENSQYQSELITDGDPWNWSWNLVLDCGGRVTSTSTETGDPASLQWAWEWDWLWGCPDAEPSAEPPEPEPAPERPAPAESADPAGEGGLTPSGTVDPWTWTWTFTFCGQTRTFESHAGAGTPLTWSWDWTWTWTCPTSASTATGTAQSSETASSSSGDGVSALILASPSEATEATEATASQMVDTTGGEPAVEAGADVQTVMDEAPATPLSAPFFASVDIVVELPGPVAVPSMDAVVPPVVLPAQTASTLALPATTVFGAPGAPATVMPPAGRRRHGRSTRAPATPAKPTAIPVVPAPQAHVPREVAPQPELRPQPRAGAVTRGKRDRAEARSRANERDGLLALDPRAAPRTSGSSSGAGVVPSTLFVGLAALTGDIPFAAPGPGRPVRLARELTPRGRDVSPIDHPG